MLSSEEQALLDECPMAAMVIGAGGEILHANSIARVTFCVPSASLRQVIMAALARPVGQSFSFEAELESRGGAIPCRVKVCAYGQHDQGCRIVWLELSSERATDLSAEDADRRLRYIIEMLPQAVCIFDQQDRYVLWNRRYEELYPDIADHLRPGMAFEEILQISLKSGAMPEIVRDAETWLATRMAKFRSPVAQEEQQLRDGRWLRHDDRRTPDGGAIGIRIDITELKQREEWLRQLFNANPMPMLLCDATNLSILEANQAAVDFYEVTEVELLTRRASDMHVEHQRRIFDERVLRLNEHCDGHTVWQQQLEGGRERHVLIYVRMLQKSEDRQFLITIADVTDRVVAEIEATRLANHDALTGLANRMHFYREVDRALGDGLDKVVVYCLDLDGFKPVNDVFGHAAGDEILKCVAERLREQAPESTVARLGGDEFAIFTRGEVDCDLADRVINACARPFTVRGMTIHVGVSIGIAVAVGSDRETLLHSADEALYRAKAAGRNTWRLAEDVTRVPDIKLA